MSFDHFIANTPEGKKMPGDTGGIQGYIARVALMKQGETKGYGDLTSLDCIEFHRGYACFCC